MAAFYRGIRVREFSIPERAFVRPCRLMMAGLGLCSVLTSTSCTESRTPGVSTVRSAAHTRMILASHNKTGGVTCRRRNQPPRVLHGRYSEHAPSLAADLGPVLVTVRVTISKSGRIESAVLWSNSPTPPPNGPIALYVAHLDQRALKVARSSTYLQALINCRLSSGILDYTITFFSN